MLSRCLSGIFLLGAACLAAVDWPMFRGPNGQGVSTETGLPSEFGPDRNVVWKTALPPGHSSPVLTADRIFLTAYEGDQLLAFCLDRATGRILWRRTVPRPRRETLHKASSPASPSPVTDGTNAYVFFTDFGLLSFGPDGNERWRVPLGPFNNPMGMASSPILAGSRLILNCDQESGSFLIALDKDSGRTLWRVERPEATRGFSTPLLYQAPGKPLQVLITGSYRLSAYDVTTGREEWFVRGLTWQLKPTPVMTQDTIYILGWAGGADEGQQEEVPDFAEVLKRWDANGDGGLSKTEITDERLTKDWRQLDLDDDGIIRQRDWRNYQLRRKAINAVLAFRLGGEGDMTERSFLWKYTKSLPNVPSPLLYQGILYLMKESGILTALDAATGAVLKQGRLKDAPGAYFSSPVAADGKIFTVSHEGKVSVVKPGADWEVIATNDLGEDCNATPAIADGKLYIRTHRTLFCFAQPRR